MSFRQFVPDGPRVPFDILQALEDERLVLFCGAGVSKGTGLPDFKDLTTYAFRRCGAQVDGTGAPVAPAANGDYPPLDGWVRRIRRYCILLILVNVLLWCSWIGNEALGATLRLGGIPSPTEPSFVGFVHEIQICDIAKQPEVRGHLIDTAYLRLVEFNKEIMGTNFGHNVFTKDSILWLGLNPHIGGNAR